VLAQPVVLRPAVVRPAVQDRREATTGHRPRPFELLARDGLVYFNDPDSEHAGVIDRDGRLRRMLKYQPGGTGQGREHASSGATGGRLQPPQHAPAGKAGPSTGPGVRPEPGEGRTGTASRTAALTITVHPGFRATVGQQLTFTATPRAGQRIRSVSWVLGGGGFAEGARVRHRYDRAGTYHATVTALLASGRHASASTTVTVGAGSPLAITALSVSPSRAFVNQPVRFTARVNGGAPPRWEWSVAGPAGQVTEHAGAQLDRRFATAGTYRVKVTARRGNEADTRTARLVVDPLPATAAGRPECGKLVTRPRPPRPVVLTGNLSCDGNGLVLADGVVLDLNGHAIAGSGGKGIGIRIQPTGGGSRVTGVTVRNGSVERFETGILVERALRTTVEHVTSRDNYGHFADGYRPGAGIEIQDSTRTTLQRVALRGTVYEGIMSGHSGGTKLLNPDVEPDDGMRTGCRIALQSYPVGAASVEDSKLQIEGGHVSDCALQLANTGELEMRRVVMKGGKFDLRNATVGVIERNRFSELAASSIHLDGLLLEWPAGDMLIHNNDFVANRGSGLWISGHGDANGSLRLLSNRFHDNGYGDSSFPGNGLGIGILGPPANERRPPLKITVEDTETSGNAGYGIHAEGPPGTIAAGGGNRTGTDSCVGPPCQA
jgi:PKD repeat protein